MDTAAEGRSRENWREDVAGRANVADTPELEAYYRGLEALEMGPLWTVANKIEPWHPMPDSVPMIWRWKDVRPAISRAPDLVTPEQAGRRVIAAIDPFYGILIGAVSVAIPSTIAAVRSTQAKRNTATSNGHTNGEIVELILSELGAVRTMLTHHIRDSHAHMNPEDVEKRS